MLKSGLFLAFLQFTHLTSFILIVDKLLIKYPHNLIVTMILDIISNFYSIPTGPVGYSQTWHRQWICTIKNNIFNESKYSGFSFSTSMRLRLKWGISPTVGTAIKFSSSMSKMFNTCKTKDIFYNLGYSLPCIYKQSGLNPKAKNQTAEIAGLNCLVTFNDQWNSTWITALFSAFIYSLSQRGSKSRKGKSYKRGSRLSEDSRKPNSWLTKWRCSRTPDCQRSRQTESGECQGRVCGQKQKPEVFPGYRLGG